MSGFIEVTVGEFKILLNLAFVVEVDRCNDGSCFIYLQDEHIEPDEPYEIIRHMIVKGESKHETENRNSQ